MELPDRPAKDILKAEPVSKDSKKHIDRVKNAGQWARVLGWIGLAIVPITGLFTSTTKDPGPAIVYALAVPLAIFLLYSGKYIQNFGGKHVRKFLILNAIISVLGITGIIPLFTLITSLLGISSYSKLKKTDSLPPISKQKAKLSTYEIIAVIIILIIGGGILAYSYNNGGVNTTGSPISSSKEIKEYTSVEHGFKINLPGFPEVERQTISESGYNIPYTIYSADTDNGNKAYLVGVYDFTGIEINETGALEGAVNGAVQNTKGATLIQSNFSTFLGLKSIDAHYTAPIEGSVYDGYMKGFFKGNKMYAVFTFGESEEAFNQYANTFAFTQ